LRVRHQTPDVLRGREDDIGRANVHDSASLADAARSREQLAPPSDRREMTRQDLSRPVELWMIAAWGISSDADR
jgi:hypothetical protein